MVRTFDPPINSIDKKTITSVSRLGKQIVLTFDDDLTLVLHLMIAGRLRWKEPGAKLARKARKLTKIGLPPHATRAQLMVWLSENAEECRVELTARYRRRFHRLSELAGNMRVYDRLLDKVGQYEKRLALGTAWAPTGA